MSPRLQRAKEELLKNAAAYSRDNAIPALDLATLPPEMGYGRGYSSQGLMDLTDIAEDWQSRGFGHLIESECKRRGRPIFAFNAAAFAHIDKLDRDRKSKARLRSVMAVNWNAVGAISSVIAAVAAAFAAYFSYLSLIKP